MRRKDKNVAGFLALFLGWLGVHRYYLGQTNWGLWYSFFSGIALWGRARFMIFIWLPIMLLVSLVDAVTLFAMDKRHFDEKFNGIPRGDRDRTTDFDRKERRRYAEKPPQRVRQRIHRTEKRSKKKNTRHNPYKQRGIEKFKEYDYGGAIEEFKKSLEIVPNDVSSHFNLACAYSLTEDADQAFYHLDRAVHFGFRDFQKIREHHALAFLRIQNAYEAFEANEFRIPPEDQTSPELKDDMLSTEPDLLDQLRKLGEMRERGLLTEQEFEQQKKRLMS